MFIVPLISPRLQLINTRTEKQIIKKMYGYAIIPQIYLIERVALKKLPNIATLSSSKKREIADFYGIDQSRIMCIKPGINTDHFQPIANNDEKLSILEKIARNIDASKNIILTVCRLVEEKNIASLIAATKKLKQDCVLYVVGDGPLKFELQKIASESGSDIVFFGERADVDIFYKISTLFVLPSTYEGFGHVYLEAMACGCPIIGVANNPPLTITATEEIIEENINGFTSPGPLAIELANTINNALNSDLATIRKRCRQIALTKYSWDSHFQNLLLMSCHEKQ